MVHAAIVVFSENKLGGNKGNPVTGDIKIVLRHAVIIGHLIGIETGIRVIAKHGVHLRVNSVDGVYGIGESSRFSVLSFNGRNVETFGGQSAINNFFLLDIFRSKIRIFLYIKLDGGELFVQEGSRGFIFTNNTRDLNLRIEFHVDNL